MTKPFDVITEYLDHLEWRYVPHEGEGMIKFGLAAQNCKLDCLVHVIEDQEFVLFFTVLPILVPENKRLSIAEYITRANYGLNAGCFEMDFEDGEVRFRTYANTDSNALNIEIVRHLLHTNVQTMDKYSPGLMKVVYGNISPSDAVKEVENANDDEEDDDTNRLLKDLLE